MRILLLVAAAAFADQTESKKNQAGLLHNHQAKEQLEEQPEEQAADVSSELFRAFRQEGGDNQILTKTTLATIEQNIKNHLNALIDDRGIIEKKLYELNLASQLAVNVSKSEPITDDRKDLILDKLYAALKLRCSSGTKLLIADFARRKAQNELAGIADLVVQNSNCKVAMTQPLKLVPLVDDVIVAAADQSAQTGQLKESSLAVFQDGVVVDSWPVAAIDLPLEALLALPPCFTFSYLGGPVAVCASSSSARDDWIKAITYNILCLKDGIGRGLNYPGGSIPSAASLLAEGKSPAQTDEKPSEKPAAPNPKAKSPSTTTTTTTTTLPGALNLFIGVSRDNEVKSAKDRRSLQRELARTGI